MTKGIAQMYMLKLYMHEAGQERHYRNDEGKAMMWWNRVDSITEVMIKDGEYSLQKITCQYGLLRIKGTAK